MRSLNLLKVAAEAELLRLRAMMARQGRRAAFALIALIFALAVLMLAELAGWQALWLYEVHLRHPGSPRGQSGHRVSFRPAGRALVARARRTRSPARAPAGARRRPRVTCVHRGPPRRDRPAWLGSSGWSPRIVAFSPQARAQEIVSPGTRRGSEPPVQPKFEASRSLVAVRQSKTLIAMVATRTCADLLAQ
jgi:hypothetical protein